MYLRNFLIILLVSGSEGFLANLFSPLTSIRSTRFRPTMCQENQNVETVLRISRRDFQSFVASTCVIASFSFADRANAAGQFAKMDVGKFVDDVYGKDDVKKGPSVYDASAEEVMKKSNEKIQKEWNKMVSEVDKALDAKRCVDAQGSLGLRMGTIKSAMREIARIAAGGDILVRDKGEGKSANFDFSSGTFEYKAVAQKAEDIFTSINKLNEKCRIKDPAGAKAEWTGIKDMFQAWQAML